MSQDIYTIRQAKLEDRPALLELAKELYETSPYAVRSLDNDRLWHNLGEWLTSDKNQRIVIVVESLNEIAGFIVAFTTPSVFNFDKIAYELAWWVKPSHTKRHIAFKLVEAYEWWAKEVGCNLVSMARFSDHPLSEKIDERLSERGYKPVENVFMKAVD